MIGLIGKKLGMTRIVTETGVVAVSVIEFENNRIAQIKTEKSDGYSSVQVVAGTRKTKRLNAAQKGHLAKYKAGAAKDVVEFRDMQLPEAKESGDELTIDIFAEGQYVDVTSNSKGKGFAGVIKRHGFSSNRATHGNSRSHRKPGSTGQCQDPGRTFPGKKMPGRLGNVRHTTQNLKIMRVDNEENIILVKGAIPGMPGNTIIMRSAVKRKGE